MKRSLFCLLLTVALLAWAPAHAQTADDTETPPPPAGSTVITSDELHSDQTTHISVFTGNVVVVGTNFKMTCHEMTVYFTTANKVDKMVATGDVIITQPGRVTHCGHAEYFHDEDKFILTDQPTILDNKQTLSSSIITIYRTTQKLVTGGGRTTVTIPSESMGSNSNKTNPPNTPPTTP